MTANQRSTNDSSAGRTTGDAALRGALLVGVAVVIGALLLWRGHDSDATNQAGSAATTTIAPDASGATGDSGATASGETGPVATGNSGATATGPTGPVETLHSPAEVKVLVANGTGSANGAGNVTARLQPKAYTTLSPANASTSDVAASKVYYREGYSADAKQIARDLGIAEPVEAVVEAMPAAPPVTPGRATELAATANVLVVIGLDGKIVS